MCRNSMTLVPSCVHSMFVIPAPCGPMTKMARWKRPMVSSTPAEPSKTTNSRSVRGNKRKMPQYQYTQRTKKEKKKKKKTIEHVPVLASRVRMASMMNLSFATSRDHDPSRDV